MDTSNLRSGGWECYPFAAGNVKVMTIMISQKLMFKLIKLQQPTLEDRVTCHRILCYHPLNLCTQIDGYVQNIQYWGVHIINSYVNVKNVPDAS